MTQMIVHGYHSPWSHSSSLESLAEHNQEALSLAESESLSFVSANSHQTHEPSPALSPKGEPKSATQSAEQASFATVSEAQTSSVMPPEDGAVPQYVDDVRIYYDDPHTDERLHGTGPHTRPTRAREEPTSAYEECSVPSE